MPSYTIIGGDKKEYGPASPEEIRHWIADGRLNAQSLIRQEGSADWEPLGNLTEFFAALHAETFGQTASPDGVPPSFPLPLVVPEVRIGQCLLRSFNLVASNSGVLLLSVFVVAFTGFVLQLLPFVGAIYWVIKGVLYGGLSIVYLEAMRGQPVTPADTFSGFHNNFAPLMLVGMLTTALTKIGLLFCFFPGIYLGVCWAFAIPLVADRNMDFWPAMELSRKTVNRVWLKLFALLFVAFLPFVFMTVYSEVHISQKLWPVFRDVWAGSATLDLAALMEKLKTVLPEIAKESAPLLVGTKVTLLFILPVSFGALMFAYEDIFGPRKPGAD